MISIHRQGKLHEESSAQGAYRPTMIRSEFSRSIQNYNMATVTNMNRNLTRTFRDVNSTIDILVRKQQTTYKSMCKIVEIQKKRVKDGQRRYQAELRDTTSYPKTMVNKTDKLPSLPQSSPPEVMLKQQEKDIRHGRKELATNKGSSNNRMKNSDHKPEGMNSRLQISAEPSSQSLPNPTQQSNEKADRNKQETSDIEEALTSVEPISNLTEVTLEDIRQDREKRRLAENDNQPGSDREEYKSMQQMATTETSDNKGSSLVINFPTRSMQKKAFFTASLRPAFPAITEDGRNPEPQGLEGKDEKSTNRVRSGTQKPAVLPLPPICRRVSHQDNASERSVVNGHAPSSRQEATEDRITEASAQIAKSLHSKIVEFERAHIADFLKRSKLEARFDPEKYRLTEGEQSTVVLNSKASMPTPDETTNRNKSIAAERRRIAKMRAAHRKAVLNSESIYVYHQSADGAYMAEPSTYKRKHFLPPSNRDLLKRNKILKAIRLDHEEQVDKIGNFFAKLDLPIPQLPLAKRRLPPEFKQPTPEPEMETTPALIEREKSEIKPLSEVAKSVAYIREYIRPTERSDVMPAVTSWSQRTRL